MAIFIFACVSREPVKASGREMCVCVLISKVFKFLDEINWTVPGGFRVCAHDFVFA